MELKALAWGRGRERDTQEEIMTTRRWQMQVALVGVLCLLPALGLAQVAAPPRPGDVKLKTMRAQLVAPPSYQVSSMAGAVKGTAYNKKWLAIEVDFSTDPDWVDGVTVKYYVLVKKGREVKLFTGEVTHSNLAKSMRHTSAMFVPATILERYGDSKFEIASVELIYDGKTVGRESSPQTREEWWQKFTPVTGMLLPPGETPWAMLAHERYEPTTAYGAK
jgi:hypothetical protein